MSNAATKSATSAASGTGSVSSPTAHTPKAEKEKEKNGKTEKAASKPTSNDSSISNSDEGMLADDKLRALEAAIRVVDDCLLYIQEHQLGVTDTVKYILQNSVNVQRCAVLQQLRYYMDLQNPGAVQELLHYLSTAISSYDAEVQVACAIGMDSVLELLSDAQRVQLMKELHPVVGAAPPAAADAWRSTYFSLLKRLPSTALQNDVFPRAVEKAAYDKTASEKLFASQMLCAIVESYSDLCSHAVCAVTELCSDGSCEVRRFVAEKFSVFCAPLAPLYIKEKMLPPLMKLLLDEDPSVTCAAFAAMIELCSKFDRPFLNTFVYPIVRQYIVGCPVSVLETVVLCFGKLIWSMRECFAASDCEFMVTVYLSLAQSQEDTFRRHCAFNYPGVLASFDVPYRDKLLPVLNAFCADSSVKVRYAIAAGFHEVCKLIHVRGDAAAQLKTQFFQLFKDMDVGVCDRLVPNLETIFCEFHDGLSDDQRKLFFEATAPLLVEYIRRASQTWRKLLTFLKPFERFPQWFSTNDLQTRFVPVLVDQLQKGAVALNGRIAVIVAMFLRTVTTVIEDRVKSVRVLQQLIAELGKSKSAAGRIAFIDLCDAFLMSASCRFFSTFLLQPLLALKLDAVSNVRYHLVKLLPRLMVIPAFQKAAMGCAVAMREDADPDVAAASLAASKTETRASQFDEERDERLLDVDGLSTEPATIDAAIALEQKEKVAQAQRRARREKRLAAEKAGKLQRTGSGRRRERRGSQSSNSTASSRSEHHLHASTSERSTGGGNSKSPDKRSPRN